MKSEKNFFCLISSFRLRVSFESDSKILERLIASFFVFNSLTFTEVCLELRNVSVGNSLALNDKNKASIRNDTRNRDVS